MRESARLSNTHGLRHQSGCCKLTPLQPSAPTSGISLDTCSCVQRAIGALLSLCSWALLLSVLLLTHLRTPAFSGFVPVSNSVPSCLYQQKGKGSTYSRMFLVYIWQVGTGGGHSRLSTTLGFAKLQKIRSTAFHLFI